MKNHILIVLCFFSLTTSAQIRKTKVVNLNIGQTVPDLLITNIINYSKPSVRLSQFKNQLLIIDFWATNCKGCVAALPRMEALQKQFQNRVTILPVTYEKKEDVLSFIKKNKYTKNLNFPSVVEDLTLSKLFKHQGVPHEVWIYKGKVVGITDLDYVDSNNIETILTEKKPDWPIKNDFLAPYDYKKPLMESKITKQEPTSYSAIFGYIEGISPKLTLFRDSIRGSFRTIAINSSIVRTYLHSWNKVDSSLKVRPYLSSICLEVQNPEKYEFTPKLGYWKSWLRENAISYESLVPDTGQNIPSIYRNVISDLDRLLNIHGRWEKRKTKCLILTKMSNNDLIRSKGGDKSYGDLNGQVWEFRNVSIESLTDLLNQQLGNPPTFNSTNYQYPIDLDLNIEDWTELTRVKEALNKFGLDLIEEIREIKMFVISDQKS
ncbi:TlpA disulfide reductase family protein [Pedobacter gandavensis]|uniref:TlpA family protein disulfide reductase n=1 Tax=Pedobacter gandavensis TaxID=2679963 RepID=UPI00292CAB69|nr:TlpA disulfide reductase family protein [Pedobacter gandavensis]